MYAATRHASLQSAAATLTHLVGLLAGLDIDLDAYRVSGSTRGHIALDVGDLYWRDEPITIRARAESDRTRLHARVRAARGGPPVARAALRRGPADWHTAELAPLSPGSYRVIVTGGPTVEPAEDVFVVVRNP